MENTYLNASEGGSKPSKGGKRAARQKANGAQEDSIVQYLYKTKMCYHWQNGYCMMGNCCNFAHGVHELRVPKTVPMVDETGQHIVIPPQSMYNPEFSGGGDVLHTYHGTVMSPRGYTMPFLNGSELNDSLGFSNGVEVAMPVPTSSQETEDISKREAQQDMGSQKQAIAGDSSLDASNASASLEDTARADADASHRTPERARMPGKSGFSASFPIDTDAAGGKVQALKPLRIRVGKGLSPQNHEEPVSVKTPKWAGWLLDTPPHESGLSEGSVGNGDGSQETAGDIEYANGGCSLCGRGESKPEMSDASVQCTLLK